MSLCPCLCDYKGGGVGVLERRDLEFVIAKTSCDDIYVRVKVLIDFLKSKRKALNINI